MSDGEAEQERRRVQQMVKGIARANQFDNHVQAENGDAKKNVKAISKRNKAET
jgi:hypothetical protein